MRSIWKGTISFGLVTIPVKLYSATDQRGISFRQVHEEDAGRIRYRRHCEVCGKDVAYSDIAKGYELATGETVVLTDDDFAELPLSTSRTIEVLRFVPMEQVDPIHFAKSYYLEPDREGAKPYVLLRDALEETGKVAIVKIALRQRESLATLRARDGVFVLETMLWPEEIRPADFDFLDQDVQIRSQELQMATSLIDTMSGDFEPEQYHDEYRAALQAVIDAKIEGREVVQPEAPEESPPVVDLMSALQASVEAARESREGTAISEGEPEEPRGGSGAAGDGASSGGSSRRSGAAGGSQGSRKSGKRSTGESDSHSAKSSGRSSKSSSRSSSQSGKGSSGSSSSSSRSSRGGGSGRKPA